MATSPITSWQIEGGKVETLTSFIFWDSWSLWTVTTAMKLQALLLGRKAMTKLDGILKSRDIILPYSQSYGVFTVVMYGCESWTIKKAEHQRINILLNCGVGEDS